MLSHINSFYIHKGNATQQFWTSAHVAGKRMTEVPVHVFTSQRTFSAAEETPSRQQVASRAERPDAGTVDLGEMAVKAPSASVKEPPKQEAFVQKPAPKPSQGQLTPDAKCRCPGRKQFPISGGCWEEHPAKGAEECEEKGQVFIKDRCYSPVMGFRRNPPRPRPLLPTSSNPPRS